MHRLLRIVISSHGSDNSFLVLNASESVGLLFICKHED